MNKAKKDLVLIPVRSGLTTDEYITWRLEHDPDFLVDGGEAKYRQRYGHWTIRRVALPADLAVLFKLTYC